MKFIHIIGIMVLIAACSKKEDNFILSARIVQVQFSDQIEQGDWFKLDNLEFNHIHNDTTDLFNQPELNHIRYFENTSQEFVDKGYLPISRLNFHVDGQRQSEKVPAGRIAGLFIQRLYQKQADLQEGDLIYQVGQAEFLILGGKVFIKRSDDKPIAVTGNVSNHIGFKELSKDDDLYKRLFGLE